MTDLCVVCFEEKINEEDPDMNPDSLKNIFGCGICEKKVCIDCLIDNLNSKLGMNEIKKSFNEKRNGLNCFLNQNNCDGIFTIQLLTKKLSEEHFNKFYEQWSRCLKMMIENDTIEEQKKIERLRREEEEKKSQLEKKVDFLIDHLFILKCPKCSNSFDTFTGCFSLQCCNCNTNFCAWCLEYNTDNSDECHHHVLQCNRSMVTDSYYGTIKQFEVSNKERIKNHLNSIKNEELFIEIIVRLKTQLSEYKLVYDPLSGEIVDEQFIKIRDIKNEIADEIDGIKEYQVDLSFLQQQMCKKEPEERFLILWDSIKDPEKRIKSISILHEIRTQIDLEIIEKTKRQKERLERHNKERDSILKEIYEVRNYLFDNHNILKQDFQPYDLYFSQKFLFLFSLRYKYNTEQNLSRIRKIRDVFRGNDVDDVKLEEIIEYEHVTQTEYFDNIGTGRKITCSNCRHVGNHSRRNCPVIVKEYMLNGRFNSDIKIFLTREDNNFL